MRLSEVDRALGAANPLSRSAERDLALPPLDGRICCGAEVVDAAAEFPRGAGPEPTLRGGRRRVAIGLAVALLALGGALLTLAGGGSRPGPQRAFAAAAVRVAQTNPRLLVGEPGWRVTDAGQFRPDEGEVTFGDGRHDLAIHWYPARTYRSYLRDRASVSPPRHSTLLGRAATTVRYSRSAAGAEYATMLSPQGGVFVEVRGGHFSHAEYWAVLRSLRPVGVRAWLEAMPPRVVVPAVRAAVVDRMLRGVPLPPGFDASGLKHDTALLDHDQLAARVADDVSCGWVESWLGARRTGDAGAARRAVQAMETSPSWSILEGLAWSANIEKTARELRRGRLDRGAAGELVRPDGSGYALGPAWAVQLNCSSRYWRRPLHR